MISKKNATILLFIILLSASLFLFQNCGGPQTPKVDYPSNTVNFSHSPIPESCLACHGWARPTIAKTLSLDNISNLYFHSPQYNGESDCVLCHTQNETDVGISWRNGLYDHQTNTGKKVTSCSECHVGNTPSGSIGISQFNHNTISGKDCFECHTNAGTNWATTAFSHTPAPLACNSCHNSNRPSPTIYYPANKAQPSLNLFAHASQFNGTADCVTCHTKNIANIGVTWTGGFYNHKTNTNAPVATCINCHTGSRPTSHTAASGRTGDCASCHTNAGTNWNSSGDAAPATVSMLPPVGTNLATITIKHPTIQTNMSCTTCHSSYNATNSIKGFDHNEGLILASNNSKLNNSCYYCHFSPNKVIDAAVLTNNTSRTYTSGKIVMKTNSHHGKTLSSSDSCLSCHSATSVPSWNSTIKSWSTGGSWKGGED